MTRQSFFLPLTTLGLCLALTGACRAQMTSQRGAVKIGADSIHPATIRFGQALKVTCKLHADTTFGQRGISADVSARNTGAAPMYGQFYIAFFDGAGRLLGCTLGSTPSAGVRPGKATDASAAVVTLTPLRIGQVASYQVAFYEGVQPFATVKTP